jgi:small subunit ribosomal protein S6
MEGLPPSGTMTGSYPPLPRSHRGPERWAPGPEEVRAAMRPYEVMVIFDVDLEEADIRQRVERVHELVRSKGGVPGNASHWGRRTFAYEIKHRSEGYYVVLEVTAEPATMSEVDRFLALEDAVLRHKVIRQPEHVAGRAAAKPRRRPSLREARDEAPRAARSSAASVVPTGPSARSEASASTAAGAEVETDVAQGAPIAAGAAESAGTGTAAPSGDGEPTAS